jgi:hypothetical protein
MPTFWYSGDPHLTVEQTLPPAPSNMLNSWKLGQLDGKLQLVESGYVSVQSGITEATLLQVRETRSRYYWRFY